MESARDSRAKKRQAPPDGPHYLIVGINQGHLRAAQVTGRGCVRAELHAQPANTRYAKPHVDAACPSYWDLEANRRRNRVYERPLVGMERHGIRATQPDVPRQGTDARLEPQGFSSWRHAPCQDLPGLKRAEVWPGDAA